MINDSSLQRNTRHDQGPVPSLASIAVPALISGCAINGVMARDMADGQPMRVADIEDLDTARAMAPHFLKVSESVLHQVPDSLMLAATVCGGLTQYAYAFVASDAERLQARDGPAAEKLRLRATGLYRRAHGHAMAALEACWPGLRASLAQADASVPPMPDEAVALAYWGAAAWGGWISMSMDPAEVVADLPLAMALARRAWLRQPAHGSGALATLLGSFEAGRPGGTLALAQAYFDSALATSEGHSPAVLVAMAESLAHPVHERERFENLLCQALALADKRRDASARLMSGRARWLLENDTNVH